MNKKEKEIRERLQRIRTHCLNLVSCKGCVLNFLCEIMENHNLFLDVEMEDKITIDEAIKVAKENVVSYASIGEENESNNWDMIIPFLEELKELRVLRDAYSEWGKSILR